MINRVILIGRLVADPEMRYTQSGIPVVRMRLAVDRRFKNASGERETDFINLTAWRKQAELVGQYMKKGRLIAVEGSLQVNKFQTKEGENRVTYEVVVDNIQFLDRGPAGRPEEGGYPPPSDENAPPPSGEDFIPDITPDINDNDLPF
ncbi:MAG: single-stranded DNA-binding protein [Candidatus Omnitrophica bacterium]|nr:single-stranded DNA-binding protein [Candidatus Omnitrophota bacterium]